MKHTTDIAIQLTNISKKYEIHHEKPTLVEKFVKGKNETFWALKDINLTIKKGEQVSIIGSNGSGKTTLLKVMAGITAATTGNVAIDGKIVSLIDLEAGFHDDLSGIQNIYLNGMLLGMTRKELEKQVKLIISFADIDKFIDAPLFTYSSGMRLRLGFSIAVHASPNIVILDEALTTGDYSFIAKTQKKLSLMRQNGVTIIYVTHWLDYIKKQKNRVIWMKQGAVHRDGGLTVVDQYIRSSTPKT